jgi:hypothetical protein
VGPRASLDSGEEKNSQPLLGSKTPIIQPIDQCHTTELPQLPYILIYLVVDITFHNLVLKCKDSVKEKICSSMKLLRFSIINSIFQL